jgi:hypothetical protein
MKQTSRFAVAAPAGDTNMETAYLVQLIEHGEGLVVITKRDRFPELITSIQHDPPLLDKPIDMTP